MTDKYKLLIYYVHSYLEIVRGELFINKDTTVENFRDKEINKYHCDQVYRYCLAQHNYELSYNQISNGINLLLNGQEYLP